MSSIDLIEFLRGGRLGDIEVGSSQSEVRAWLGEPDDVGGITRKKRRPSIYKYGDIEFGFDHSPEQHVTHISINRSDPETDPRIRFVDSVEVNDGGLKLGMQLSEFRTLLESAQISHSTKVEFEQFEILVGASLAAYAHEISAGEEPVIDKLITVT